MNPFKQFENVLKIYIKEKSISNLPRRWAEPTRFYHNTTHLIQILKDIESNIAFSELNVYEKHALLLTAFFHDIICDPKKNDNEDKSIKLFISSFKSDDTKMLNTVCDLIETTKYRKRPTNKLEKIFWDSDNAEFKKGYNHMLKNEKLIQKEYSFMPKKTFVQAKIKFLESNFGLFGASVDKNLKKLINYYEKKY